MKRIQGIANHTPVMTSSSINSMTNCNVFFKCENFQKGGAFKFRGAYNAISQLSDEEKEKGVIAHSSGNHAQAVALASRMLDIDATIVMPRNSTKVKQKATKGYGARVVMCEPTLEGRESTTNAIISQEGQTLIHPYNNPKVIAGAGTAALELLREMKKLDFILAPVGGGGLISGTSLAARGIDSSIEVVGVEPANADDAYKSFKTGTFHPSVEPHTIADGLLTSLGELSFDIISKNVDDILLVDDVDIVNAMRLLWERMKLVVEPSSAVPLAGIVTNKDRFMDKRVGIIVSGGNVDLSSFFKELQKKAYANNSKSA
ncbi:MAG: pyridoxal-phosphate dependent enzyme [Candidatus Thorarchaeota archaeon]|nr:pyridoxal-phosphate dependent enzyme [Candidatus Thorarchaeota archaeon]